MRRLCIAFFFMAIPIQSFCQERCEDILPMKPTYEFYRVQKGKNRITYCLHNHDTVACNHMRGARVNEQPILGKEFMHNSTYSSMIALWLVIIIIRVIHITSILSLTTNWKFVVKRRCIKELLLIPPAGKCHILQMFVRIIDVYTCQMHIQIHWTFLLMVLVLMYRHHLIPIQILQQKRTI